MDGLRNENLDLKQIVRELHKEKLVMSNHMTIQQNYQRLQKVPTFEGSDMGEAQEPDEYDSLNQRSPQAQDPLISHFQNVDINQVD
jgi:hypothetical protein